MPFDIIIGRDSADKKRFGSRGLIPIGKSYVAMGNQNSLSNPIYLDVARTHVILVAGKRGSGKCLHEDTLIQLADGSQIPIKELENNKEKIISLNNYLKTEQAEEKDFFSRTVNRLLRIKLRSGKEIKLTPEHPLLTIKGWEEAQKIGIGGRIATPRIIPSFGNKEMPEHEIKLLSYLIAEGHTKSIVLFTNSDEKIVDEFRDSLTKFDSSLQLIKEKENHYRISSPNWKNKIIKSDYKRNEIGQFTKESKVWHEKRSIRNLIEKEGLFGLLATQKYLSRDIMQLNKKSLSMFLSRLFSCDGSIYKTKDYWAISYASSSEKLIRQIQNLLLRFGIVSKLRKKKIKYREKQLRAFEIVINSENTLKFIEDIGFFGRKEKKQKIAFEEISSKIRNTNIDTIPKEIWEMYKPKSWVEIGRRLGYKHPKAMRERVFYSPSRQTLSQIAEIEESNPLSILANSDIFWDEITSIEILDGEFKVYDISVPTNHNFVANDIIVHNSYTLGTIAESLSDLPQEESKNIASLIFDTMGIFWTMKYKNEKDSSLLKSWNLSPKELPVKVFVPFGKSEEYDKKSIPYDDTFALLPSELEAEDWITVFNLEFTSMSAVLITRVISQLKNSKQSFTIKEIQSLISEDHKSQVETKLVASSLFDSASSWGVFSEEKTGTEVSDLINAGKTTVLDVSIYSSNSAFNVRALVISLISKKVFESRLSSRKREEIQSIQHGYQKSTAIASPESPLVWVFIDECLTGDTEIITKTNHTKMEEIIKEFKMGKKIEVLTYDTGRKDFSHNQINQIYEKGKRKIIEITTETGRKIKCTPEHRVLTRGGFASAFSVNEIATPLIQHYSEDKEAIKARILGHLFGDGWASQKTQSLGFAGKINPNDLNLIKKDLELLELKSSNIFSRETKSIFKNNFGKLIEIKGKSHSIQASRKAYKLFDSLGVIKGDKITQKTKIPDWIKNGNDKIKAEFLAALMGSDGQKITKAKNAFGDFNAIRLSFNKLKSLRKEAIEYAEEIKDLFESLGIKISKITERAGNIRKNGSETIKIVLTLKKNLPNTILFLQNVGYRYCHDKEIEGNKWFAYLKARMSLKNERETIYTKALELHKKGLGKIKISKELSFPESQVRDWIYNKIKPGLPKKFSDFNEWINERIDKNILYERILRIRNRGEEKVYDISVNKIHNFVSNGLITHNCHEFLPKTGSTPATAALIQLLREGRQPGISLVLATQQPGQIHHDVMTQSDIVISHRVTSKQDISALNEIMQSYLLSNIQKSLDSLPSLKGSAIILDDNSERLYPMRVRPRFTWHGGEAPTAIPSELHL